MQEISSSDWLKLVRDNINHYYNHYTQECIFPDMQYKANYLNIRNLLQSYKKYISKESFSRRLSVRNDYTWKDFSKRLRMERGNKCEISGYNIDQAKKLTADIFGNNVFDTPNIWLNLHHISGDKEYGDLDSTNYLVLNRAIHMMLHMYDKLVLDLPELKDKNFKLWFELGSLTPLNGGEYPFKIEN